MNVSLWQLFGGALATLLVGWLLLRDYRAATLSRQREAGDLFGLLLAALDGPRVAPQQTAGVHCLEGRVNGHFVQIKAITDTLGLRKLPSLWLMITLPGDTGTMAVLDMVMRPAGQTSFSHFDRLTDTLPMPHGFPHEAALKTDDPARAPDPELFRPCLYPFGTGPGKELLLSPRGVRLVLQLAEAERARYGVFRQARFRVEPLRPEDILPLVTLLADLKARSLAGSAAGSLPSPPETRIEAYG